MIGGIVCCCVNMMKGIGKNRNRLNGMNDGIGLQEVLTVFD